MCLTFFKKKKRTGLISSLLRLSNFLPFKNIRRVILISVVCPVFRIVACKMCKVHRTVCAWVYWRRLVVFIRCKRSIIRVHIGNNRLGLLPAGLFIDFLISYNETAIDEGCSDRPQRKSTGRIVRIDENLDDFASRNEFLSVKNLNELFSVIDYLFSFFRRVLVLFY